MSENNEDRFIHPTEEPILTIEPEFLPRDLGEKAYWWLATLVPYVLIAYGVYQITFSDTMKDLAQGFSAIIVGAAFIIVNAVRDLREELAKAKEVYWNPDVSLLTIRTHRVLDVEEPEPADEVQSIDVGAGGDWAGVPTPHKDEVGPTVTAEEIDAAEDDKDYYEGGENPPLPPKQA